MILAIVRFPLAAALPAHEAQRRADATTSIYENMRGLLYKHYLHGDDDRTWGAVYVWDSRSAAESFFMGEWKDRMRGKYGVEPSIEWYECLAVVDNRHREVIARTGKHT